MWKFRTSLLAVLAVLTASAIAIPASAQSSDQMAPGQMSPEHKAIADRIAKEYGVTVLKTAAGDIDGKTVLYVTVMNPGGNSNSAFEVTTLAADPETGDLISQYRTTPTGQENTGPGPLEPSSDESGETMRQQSLQPTGR